MPAKDALHKSPTARLVQSFAKRYAVPGRGSTRPVDQPAHLAHGGFHAHEHGPTHDAVADVEFLDVGEGRDGANVFVGEPVARVDREPACARLRGGHPKPVEGPVRSGPRGAGIRTGVEFDCVSAERRGRVHRSRVRVDEEADPNPGIPEAGDGPAERPVGAGGGVQEIEPAFGGDFLSPLGHERGLVGPERRGELNDVQCARQLEVEHSGHRRRQAPDVVVVDVPPVFAKVDRDAIGTRPLAEARRRDGVGLAGAAGLSQGRHVIHVHIKAHGRRLLGVPGGCRLLALNFIVGVRIPQPVGVAGVLAVTLILGCGGGAHVAPVDPQAAVRSFMSAVKANSITAMGEVWGSSRGPAVANMKREELEQRLTVMRAYLTHDSFEFVQRNAPDPIGGQQRMYDVRIVRGNCRPVVPFTVVRWRDGWLVQSVDLASAGNPARPCPAPGAPPGGAQPGN